MWPLSRGETWGVPWRLVVAYLVAILAWVPVGVVYAFKAFTRLSSIPADHIAAQQVAFDLLADLVWIIPIGYVLAIPLFWFVSLLLAEAYNRFSGRLKPEQRLPELSVPEPAARRS